MDRAGTTDPTGEGLSRLTTLNFRLLGYGDLVVEVYVLHCI